MDSEETWTTEDSVSVETPMEILKILNVKGSYLSNVAQGQIEEENTLQTITENNNNNADDDNDGWVLHSEITIETPTVVMSAITGENTTSEPEAEQHYSDEWITTEEVVETPIEVLRELESQIAHQQNQPQDSNHEDEWISEEVCVELPADILQQIKSQQQGSRIPWKIDISNGNNEADAEDDCCEMPAEVLDFIREQEEQQRHRNSISTPTHAGSDHSFTSATPKQTFSSTYSTQLEDKGYSTYGSRYGRWSTHRDPPPREDVWNTTTTEETVVTPTAILNALNGNTQSNISQQYTNAISDSTQEYNQNNCVREEVGANDDEEVWETWETTEETVEAPPELLAILAQQQQQQQRS